MYTHETEKPWKCEHCDFAHALKAGLLAHSKGCQPKESSYKVCHLCGYKTVYNAMLKVHIESKTDLFLTLNQLFRAVFTMCRHSNFILFWPIKTDLKAGYLTKTPEIFSTDQNGPVCCSSFQLSGQLNNLYGCFNFS